MVLFKKIGAISPILTFRSKFCVTGHNKSIFLFYLPEENHDWSMKRVTYEVMLGLRIKF